VGKKKGTRIEKDSMGEMEVPADAYYGASTQRAVLNFPISGQPLPRRFIRALGLVKKAAAQTNLELGLLSRRRARAIAAASQQVIDGELDEQFPIDVYQTGSGTSTNTNANEVIATRATEILGGARGSRLVHPNDHVNLGQSSNDVIPTAIQLASAMAIQDELIPSLERLRKALEAKSKEFWPVVKTGRTHLQDATPIRLGQEFKGYAGQMEESIRRARTAVDELARIPLGGTAVGTGINTHPQYARIAAARLAKATGIPVRETSNHFHAQATLDSLIAAHGGLRTIATSLWKIGSDVRLMGTGPIAGLGELRLPETRTPGDAARLEHHAGQGEPRDRRVAADGDRARLRKRSDGCDLRTVGQLLRAERDDAGGRRHNARIHHPPRDVGAQLLGALHRRPSGHGPRARAGGAEPDARDRAHSCYRIRRIGEDREGVDPDGQEHQTARASQRHQRGGVEQAA
jgi:Lyase